MNHRIAAGLVLAMLTLLSDRLAAEESSPSENAIRAAVTRALPLLERASAGSADQRTCFTCHSQALPVIAMVESQRRGFHANAENLRRQVEKLGSDAIEIVSGDALACCRRVGRQFFELCVQLDRSSPEATHRPASPKWVGPR